MAATVHVAAVASTVATSVSQVERLHALVTAPSALMQEAVESMVVTGGHGSSRLLDSSTEKVALLPISDGPP